MAEPLLCQVHAPFGLTIASSSIFLSERGRGLPALFSSVRSMPSSSAVACLYSSVPGTASLTGIPKGRDLRGLSGITPFSGTILSRLEVSAIEPSSWSFGVVTIFHSSGVRGFSSPNFVFFLIAVPSGFPVITAFVLSVDSQLPSERISTFSGEPSLPYFFSMVHVPSALT